MRIPLHPANYVRGALASRRRSISLATQSLLGTDADPGRGPSEKRDAEISSEPQAVLPVERQVTGVRVPAARVVDVPARPRAVRPRREPAKDLQTDDRALTEGGVGVPPVAL